MMWLTSEISHAKSLKEHGTIDCSRHKIYCHIKAVRPKIDSKFAMKVSNLLYKFSKAYGTNPHISVAIIMQESAFRMVDRKVVAYVKTPEGEVPQTVVTDVSMFQFHVRTIENEGMDKQRLRDDLEYASEQHIKLLAKKIKVCTRVGIPSEEAWTCYHSATRHLRLKYLRDVSRYLP